MTDSELSARRYLLGEDDDDERLRIEEQYFADAEALNRMEGAEERLIEDYLADRLSPDERARFETAFLSVPHRRARVTTIRALMDAASPANRVRARKTSSPGRARPAWVGWLPLAAAAVVLIAAGTWWAFDVSRGRLARDRPQVTASSAPTAPARSSPRVFAVSLSPGAVRSAGDAAGIAVPDGTDLVELGSKASPATVASSAPERWCAR